MPGAEHSNWLPRFHPAVISLFHCLAVGALLLDGVVPSIGLLSIVLQQASEMMIASEIDNSLIVVKFSLLHHKVIPPYI